MANSNAIPVVIVDTNGLPVVVTNETGGSGGGSDTGWIPLVLNENWEIHLQASYGTPAYRIINGVVFFKGMVKRTATGTGELITILPAEIRPEINKLFSLTTSSTAVHAVQIKPNGELVQTSTTVTQYLGLSSVFYPLPMTTTTGGTTTIVNDITNFALTNDILSIDMLSGTYKEVDLSGYVNVSELTTSLSTKANVGTSYTKLEEDNLLNTKLDKTSIVGLLQQQNTTNTPISTTETAVSGISITVPKTGLYTATVRLNVKKPSGGSTNVITVRGKINGTVSTNTVRQRSVVNDNSVHYLEYSFTGNLTQGDILTLSVQASSSGASLDNGTGYVGCQFELLKIIEI